MLAHVAGIPVEEALLAAPALLGGVTVIAGYVRATAAAVSARMTGSATAAAIARAAGSPGCSAAKPAAVDREHGAVDVVRRR